MKIGLLRVRLLISPCPSLKAKRSIVKRYINRLRREFNVSVAEIDNHNHRHVCCLGIVAIYRLSKNVEHTLNQIVELFEYSPDVQLEDYIIEII